MAKRHCMSNLVMVLVISFLAAAPAAARPSVILRAEVPFEFYVGERALPAGEYTLSSASDDDSLLQLSSRDGRHSVLIMTNAASAKSGKGARLTFHKYADRLYLAAVWVGGSEEGRTLIESKRERNVRKEIGKQISAVRLDEAECGPTETQVAAVNARCEEN